jgi:hypothetical protein
MNLAVEHPCKDDGKNGTDNSSDDKNLELIQFIGPFAVLINNYIFHHRDRGAQRVFLFCQSRDDDEQKSLSIE